MGILKKVITKVAKDVITSPEARRVIVNRAAKDPSRFDALSRAIGGFTDDEMQAFTFEVRRLKKVQDPVGEVVSSSGAGVPPVKPPVKPDVLPSGRPAKLPEHPSMVVEVPGKVTDLEKAPVRLGVDKITDLDIRLQTDKPGVPFSEEAFGKLSKWEKKVETKRLKIESDKLRVEGKKEREKYDSDWLGDKDIERTAKQLIETGQEPKARAITEAIPRRKKTGLTLLDKLEPRRLFKVFDSKTINQAMAFSPHYLARRIYGWRHNPVADKITCFISATTNTARDTVWWNKLVKIGALGTSSLVRNNVRKIARESSEVLTKVEKPYKASISQWKAYQGYLVKIKGNPTKQEQITIVKIQQSIKDLEDEWVPEWMKLMDSLSDKYSDTRIYLGAMYKNALEKPVKGNTDPLWFIRGKLNEQEKHIAGKVREYLDVRGAEAERMGLEVLGPKDIEEAYVPFLWQKYLKPVLPKKVRDRFVKDSNLMREYLNFMERAQGTKAWVPSVRASMKYYIPTINKKLADQPFRTKWSEHYNKLITDPRNEAESLAGEWWKKWCLNAFNKDMNHALNRFVNNWVNFDYIRLISLNPSVAFKHLLKMAMTPAERGGIAYFKGIGSTGKLLCQYLKQRTGRKLGIKSWEDGYYAHLIIGEHFLSTRAILQSMHEMPGMPGMLANARLLLNFPTSLAELFDRSINIFAALHAGAAKGASFEVSKRQIMHAILDVNFLGGYDQPIMFRHPLQRMFLGMFQSTPLKIAERHVRSLTGAANDIKEKIMGDALKGVNAGRIKTDMYGTTEGTKVLRAMAIIGSMSYISVKVFDVNIHQYMVHVPFVQKTRTGGHTVGLGPVPKTLSKWSSLGDPFIDVMYDNYLYIGILDKWKNIREDTIPTMYEGNPWRYALTSPSMMGQLDREEIAAVQRMRQRERMRAFRGQTWLQEKMQSTKDFFSADEPEDETKKEGYLWGD